MTAARDASDFAATPIRLRPAPVREPAFDDEPAPPRLSVVGPLDRPLPFRSEPAAPISTGDQPRRGLAPVTRVARPTPATATATAIQAATTAAQRRPDPAAFAQRLSVAIIEIGTGRRSPSQLRDHVAPAVFAGITRDAGRITRLGSAARPATLHSLHLTETVDGCVEVAAVLRIGSRFRAMAVRIELHRSRWRCVRLQIG